MSTELVAIERINIKKDNGDADALRSCLAHYLQQFLDSASIESMTLHELTIRIDGISILCTPLLQGAATHNTRCTIPRL